MNTKETRTEVSESRRKFIKTAAYATPVVVTMAVAPSVYANGSAGPAPGQKPGPTQPL